MGAVDRSRVSDLRPASVWLRNQSSVDCLSEPHLRAICEQRISSNYRSHEDSLVSLTPGISSVFPPFHSFVRRSLHSLRAVLRGDTGNASSGNGRKKRGQAKITHTHTQDCYADSALFLCASCVQCDIPHQFL